EDAPLADAGIPAMRLRRPSAGAGRAPRRAPWKKDFEGVPQVLDLFAPLVEGLDRWAEARFTQRLAGAPVDTPQSGRRDRPSIALLPCAQSLLARSLHELFR